MKKIAIDVDPLYLSIFDADQNRWRIPSGEFRVLAGASSRDLPLSTTVRID